MSDQKEGAAQETPNAVPESKQTAEPKPADAAGAATGVPAGSPSAAAPKPTVPPEKYDLKLSDDSPFDAVFLERIAAEARERGLSNEDAQKLIDRDDRIVTGYIQAQGALLRKTSEAWVEEAKTDKEIGGSGFKKNIETARRYVDRFGSESLKKALNETGLGNHPELIRMIVRAASTMADDTLVMPKGQASAGKRPMEEAFYGKSTQ